MKTYKIFKYTNDVSEYYEAINKGFRANVLLKDSGNYLIQFDETNIQEDAEEICRIESRNFNCRCFVSLDGDKIFLTDYRKHLTNRVP